MRAIRRAIQGLMGRKWLIGVAALAVAAAATITVNVWPRHVARTIVIDDVADPSTPPPTSAGSPGEQSASPSPSSSQSSEKGSAAVDPPKVWYQHPSVSRDAAIVAFTIRDAYYGPEAPNGAADVFVRSRATHRTSRISMALDGSTANGDSDNPAMSADGTRVAFVSEASDIVAGDTNRALDVFVRDMIEHVTVRVSVSSKGTQGNGPSGSAPDNGRSLGRGIPAISADGRYVAFESSASNLAPDDSNGQADVFIHDLKTGDTVLVSVADDGRSANDASHHPSISADGRIVAFYSEATNLTADIRPAATRTGVFVRDITDGKTALVSVSASGEWLPEWNGWPSISGSGDVVGFINIPDLFDPPSDSIIEEGGDIVRRDLKAATTTRVDPKIQSYHMKRVALSGDGDVTAFVHLIGGMDSFCYVLPPQTRSGYLGACDREWLSISSDGRYIAFGAGLDALSVPGDEERFDGDYGAMIYDRETDTFVAAWKL